MDPIDEVLVWRRREDGLVLAQHDGAWHYIGFTPSEYGALEAAARRGDLDLREVDEPEDLEIPTDAPMWAFATGMPVLDPRSLLP